MKWLRDILTVGTPPNDSYDWVRVVAFIAALEGLGLELYVVVARQSPFDFVSFGTGLGLLIAAGAGGMWARKDVEPPHRDREDG